MIGVELSQEYTDYVSICFHSVMCCNKVRVIIDTFTVIIYCSMKGQKVGCQNQIFQKVKPPGSYAPGTGYIGGFTYKAGQLQGISEDTRKG